MSSTYGGDSGSGPPSGDSAEGSDYGQGGYDPGAPGGIPSAATGGFPEAGGTESAYQGSHAGDAYQTSGTQSTGTHAGAASTGAASSTYAAQAGATATGTDRPDVEDESVGSLVGKLTTDVSKLIRQELDLAKAEVREEAKKAGKAAGMLGGAGLAGLMVAVFASLTLIFLLDWVMFLWLAALIVTLLWAILGAVLFMMGRKKLAEVNPKPEQTIETLKEDKEWVQAQKS